MSYIEETRYAESIPVELRAADELVRVATRFVELRGKRDLLQTELMEIERLMKEADNQINKLLREGGKADERIIVIKNAALHAFNNSLEDTAARLTTASTAVRYNGEDIEELKASLF